MPGKRQRFADRRKARGYSQESFAEKVGTNRSTVYRWEAGDADPHPFQRSAIQKALDVTLEELNSLLHGTSAQPQINPFDTRIEPSENDEFEAWELMRRVEASDVGAETLNRLEKSFDDLAMAYPITPPQQLLQHVRQHSAYVAQLLDVRRTLKEHRRLLVVGGWLSLFGATLHIDLKQENAATARLQTAAALAKQAEHPEIQAWCLETEAWRVLTSGDYSRAVQLSQAAQSIAPSGSSALIQSTAQEGRALARLGQADETYAAIDRVQKLSGTIQKPDNPEHHYRYDPAKALAYTATTLAWLGDRSAEPYAREVIARLQPSMDITKWPRRVASANIDLALVLLKDNRLDEACDSASKAIQSGRVVPSNYWRALEVVKAVEARQLPEATDLREAYQGMKSIGN